MRFLFTTWLLLAVLKLYSANEIIVAKDGTGNFTTIQEALNSVSTTNDEWITIIVKNGTYNEHVMINSNHIALVGESRSATHIEYSIPRKDWYTQNGSNTGTGVINIAAGVHDIVVANMYVRNTYEGAEDYTEVSRSEPGSTRLWFINLDVLCLWKDTFAPWGKAGGMYYVSECNFRGSIDAFCPRGYCYAINCRFTETKSSSPIWHEGVSDEDQKLVIQGGSVHSEYNKNVKLQNCQNYAKFYYLDVQLSDSITDLGKSATTSFYGVTGAKGLSWFANSLTLDSRKEIDAYWSFDKKWNPERVMPHVLPFAALPQPYNGRYAVSAGTATLRWKPARNTTSCKIYFGTSEQPELYVETVLDTIISPILEKDKTYFWRVDCVTPTETVEGKLWQFSTSDTLKTTTTQPPVDTGNDSIDYTSVRLSKFNTTLHCKTMSREPVWIEKTGSVNWSNGTGYKWGSSNALLTIKVNGCTKVEITYANGSTSRPIIVTDGGGNNDVTEYPTASNAEKTLTFIPKNTDTDDIVVKTSGSSGLTVSKMVFYGIQSSVEIIKENLIPFFKLEKREITSQNPLKIITLSSKTVGNNIRRHHLSPGAYIVQSGQKSAKIIVY